MKKNPLVYVFFIVLFGLFFLDILNKDKLFSELENRNLQGKVQFEKENFFNNKFQKKYEEYINDQFIFRDNFISLKSRAEFAFGKIENNGIIYGDNNYMFEKFDRYDIDRIKKNIDAVNILVEKQDKPISIMIAPTSYEIYNDYLPKSAPVPTQSDKIKYIYENLNVDNKVNVLDVLTENKDKYIYYKTDHHWTTYGAYLAYTEFIKSRGLKPVKLEDLEKTEVPNFYGTYFSKAKPFNAKSDILSYYDTNDLEMKIYDKKFDSIYDYSQLDKVDKYGIFLSGNNALVEIKNKDLNNNKKILIIKDSYANSLIPFLTYNYEYVDVIDLRHFNENINEYISKNNYDDVLLLYNFINFSTDIQLVRFKY